MNCSFQNNTGYLCLAHNFTRHMAYIWGFSYLDYSIDVLVSSDWKWVPQPSIYASYISFFITLIMLHLTFNLSCFIAGLCAYNPSSPHPAGVLYPSNLPLLGTEHKWRTADSSWAFVPQVVSLYRVQNTNACPRALSIVGFTPLGALSLLQGFFLLRIPSSLLRWWANSHSEAYVNQTPLLRLSPLGALKVRRYLWWDNLHSRTTL